MFSSVWLHYENCSRKCFHVFGCILKMLFSYYFLTFSQLPNKFYNRKFQYINLKQTKIKIKPNKNQNKTFPQFKNSVKRRGGRESDQKLRERERSVMGHGRRDRDDKIGGGDELWVENKNEIGNVGADEIGFGW